MMSHPPVRVTEDDKKVLSLCDINDRSYTAVVLFGNKRATILDQVGPDFF